MSSPPSNSVSPFENQPSNSAFAPPRLLGWGSENLLLTPLGGEVEWREHFQTEIGPPLPSLILQAPRFEAESENEQQEIQQLSEWQGNPLPLSLMEPRQENWWEIALGGSVGAEEKESISQEKCMWFRNESQITNPTYRTALWNKIIPMPLTL